MVPQMAPAEKLLEEYIENRKHEHAEEGADEPPAKGGHAKQTNADAHEQLAQRRMGGFIDLAVFDMFQSGAGMVNFIEIGFMVPAGLFGHGLQFIKEGGRRVSGLSQYLGKTG